MTQQILDILPVADPSLQNFIPGRNRELMAMISKTLQNKNNERFFYVWGGSGCGKSHLLQGMVEHFINRQKLAYYFPGELPADFDISDDLNCLAIDNVEHLNECAQLKLFNIYNQLRDREFALLIVSGSIAPSQLDMRRDLVTRLCWGLVYQIHELTEQEKIEALQRHAFERGFTLESHICQYLLRHGKRDLRSLIMKLDELDKYSLIHQRKVTLHLLRELFRKN
ncbi:MAG: DnaA regulatory inactivator Hda [Nitrosomonas sp.]|nr:DnaA regulatory inactivator Hda [Nitrosomonas sp.]MCP5251187.1 DnaA regulatory inactivator Hda [Burkholderiales bacterium]MDR4520960.1 DnaA regulatory inactivator Hda [Nitrosomonas sp.]HQU61636.1 DnaA regulatory inactivator Hda [Nitrosomonas sp.]